MEVPISRPFLPEQRANDEALSDVDTLLDWLDRLIAKNRDIKQAAMQEILTGRTKILGFSGEWEEKRLAVFNNLFVSITHSRNYLAHFICTIVFSVRYANR